MNPIVEINERVDMVVLYRKHGDISTLATPYKMKWRNKEIEFKQLGMRHPTKQGRRTIHIFDVSDGCNDYRLEHDAERLTWTLIYLLPGGVV